MKDDTPFVGEVRNRPAERREFFARCESELIRLGHRYVVIDGPIRDRLGRAVKAVDALLAEPR